MTVLHLIFAGFCLFLGFYLFAFVATLVTMAVTCIVFAVQGLNRALINLTTRKPVAASHAKRELRWVPYRAPRQ